ncbi:MAG: PQQ-binding-like beta-propeller repeat protein, partial [Planctomycetes bacterium]|nr:PQQ-binding-like beta-propeller repeat protein [Planctomycetota bacterium]
MKSIILLSCIALAAIGAGLEAADSAANVGWRNDGSGHFTDVQAPTEWSNKKNIAWETELPNFSTSSVIAVGDKLFAASKEYDLICLSKKDGKILWVQTSAPYDAATAEDKKRKPDLWKEAAALIKKRDALNKKMAGSKNAFQIGAEKHKIEKQIDKLLFKTNPKRYKGGWSKDGGMANGTPASDGKHVYVYNSMGIVACFNLDGKKIWCTHLTRGQQEHSYHQTPLLIDGKVVFVQRAMIALDAKTGA